MKTLKLGLLSLLAVLAVSVFLTSCEQEDIVNPEVALQINNHEEEVHIQDHIAILPVGFNSKSKEEIESFFSQLTEGQLYNLGQHARIGYYLEEIGLREQVEADMNTGDIYTEVDLGLYLSSDQIRYLKSFSIINYRNSYCGEWTSDGIAGLCTNYILGWCSSMVSCKRDKRSCAKWPYIEYRYDPCW